MSSKKLLLRKLSARHPKKPPGGLKRGLERDCWTSCHHQLPRLYPMATRGHLGETLAKSVPSWVCSKVLGSKSSAMQKEASKAFTHQVFMRCFNGSKKTGWPHSPCTRRTEFFEPVPGDPLGMKCLVEAFRTGTRLSTGRLSTQDRAALLMGLGPEAIF